MLCSELFETQPTRAVIIKSLVDSKSPERTFFLRPSLTPPLELSEYSQKIQDSYERPTEIDGGSILFHGNIFAEGYFRMTRLGKPKATAPTTESLANSQTWFKWHPDTQTYTEEHGSSQMILLDSEVHAGKVTLYRGLNKKQVDQLKKLKSGDTSALSEIFSNERDSMFFTTSREDAKKWAKGYYIELKVDEADIQKSYVGFEYNYIEIAIHSAEVLQNSIKTLKVTAVN